MPVMRKNIKKGKFSNYGNSVFAKKTSNTNYFAQRNYKQPTMRGAFPKAIRYSLNDEGITNARINYNRGLKLNSSAAMARNYQAGNQAAMSMSAATLANGIYGGNKNSKPMQNASQVVFEGNAARKISALPKTIPAPKKKKQTFTKSKVSAVRGQAQSRGILQTSALSPTLLVFAKYAAAVVIFLAVVAFVRVGLSSATISKGIESQQISSQIETELTNKNALEVQDSVEGNSTKVRQAAEKLGMITPPSIETIKLEKDVVARNDDGDISLVESLNRIADSAK